MLNDEHYILLLLDEYLKEQIELTDKDEYRQIQKKLYEYVIHYNIKL